jgi:hypothetical protein
MMWNWLVSGLARGDAAALRRLPLWRRSHPVRLRRGRA